MSSLIRPLPMLAMVVAACAGLAACHTRSAILSLGDKGATPDFSVIAREIRTACPVENDQGQTMARDRCAQRLAGLKVLTASSEDNIRWGAVRNGDFNPSNNSLTELNSFVWRKLYLSLFAFTGGYSVETLSDNSKLLRLDVRLRILPPEEFPYPFWHSEAKWESYQQSRQIALLFVNGRLTAGYRNSKVDPTASTAKRPWSGEWTWPDARGVEPRVALYSYLLSPRNPNRVALDDAYRAFEAAARPYSCNGCHNPKNPKNMNPLVFFTHPSQALTARHALVDQLVRNKMPPDKGIPDVGDRNRLIALARQFARTGDDALAFEARRADR